MIVIPAMAWPESRAMGRACFSLCPELRWHDEQELVPAFAGTTGGFAAV